MCWLCGGKEKAVAHAVSKCPTFVQNKYKRTRHENVAGEIIGNFLKNGELKELIKGMNINP